MSTSEIIELAAKHLAVAYPAAFRSSAAVSLADARRLAGEGRLVQARQSALDSLRYSIGMLHDDYIRAARVVLEVKS